MPERGAEPRALFLFPDEPPQSDAEVCSGRYRNWLEGEPCPYSEAGRMPWPESADPEGGPEGDAPLQEGEAAQPGAELIPPCVQVHLGCWWDWRAGPGRQSPPRLGGRPLLKCKQMFLLVLAIGWRGGPEGEV